MVPNTTPPPTVSLAAPGSAVLTEGDSTTLVVNLNAAAPAGGVLVQLDSLQTVPSTTPDNVIYELDYRVTLQDTTATNPACAIAGFSFDSATTPGMLIPRRVVVPFPAGCTSQTLELTTLEDMDGLDETLAFSLVEVEVEDAGYTVTSVPTERSRTLTVTDNEPVVTLGLLGDPLRPGRELGVVTERNYIAVDVLLPATYDLNVSPSVTVNLEVSGDINAADVVTFGAGFTPLTAFELAAH